MKELRHNMRIISLLLVGLFVAFAVYFSYAIYFYGGRWFGNPYNPRLRSERAVVNSGDILDRNGVTLATTNSNGDRVYTSDKALRLSAAHVVGDTQSIIPSGAETFFAPYLLGFKASLIDRARALFSGGVKTGDNICLTIDAELNKAAAAQLGDNNGAIVMLNYKTGEILASTSKPTFDLSSIESYKNAGGSVFVNRALDGQYPPGSVFKVVTTAAAIKSGYSDMHFNCEGETLINGERMVCNDNSVHGDVDLSAALARSCNIAMSELATLMGGSALRSMAENFCFNENFLFSDVKVSSSSLPEISGHKELIWTSVGQGRVLVTPIHMALIAGAIGNDGLMMEPRLLHHAETQSGSEYDQTYPKSFRQIIPKDMAAEIATYMRATTTSGTGGRAALNNYTVCGKTGTAQIDTGPSHAWYIGYIAEPEHPIAIAIVVENGKSGGGVAAPIAGALLSKAVNLGY